MITINFQNRSTYAKVFAEQDSGQLPLYLGPARHGKASSADISPAQFLAYFDTIASYVAQPREIDGNAALVLITDNNVQAITPAVLLQGMLDGHLGTDVQAKASAWKALRDAKEAGLQAVAAERRALLTGAAVRATI